MAESNPDVIEYRKEQLKSAKEAGDRLAEGHAYCYLGNSYRRLGYFKEAIECHMQDLNIARELGDRGGEGRAYGNLGNAYNCVGNFRKAIEYHNLHLNIAKEVGDRSGEGRAYGNLGCVYQSLGDFNQAIEYQKRRLSIIKEVGDRAAEARVYGNLGNAYHSLGDFKQAIEYHKQDLTIAKEVGDRAGEGGAYGNLGNAHHALGRYKQAIEYHTLRLSIAEEMGDRVGEERATTNLGNAYYCLGDFKRAIDYHKQGLSIANAVDDRVAVGISYCNLGNAYQSLGDFKQAIEYHKLNLSIAKKVGDRAGEGRAHGNLGIAFQSLGDFKQAIEHINHDLAIAKEMGDKAGEGGAYGNLGCAYQSLGDFQKAMECYSQHLNTSKIVGDRNGEGRAYANLGNVHNSIRDFEKAMDCYKQYLCIAREVEDRPGEGHASYSLGFVLESSGSLHEALDYYRSSVRLYNDVRALLQAEDKWKISFRNLHQDAYTALWRILLKLQKIDEALYVAEQGRAQALMDLMKSKYVSGELPSESVVPENTSDILSYISTQTAFVALGIRSINFWTLSKENEVRVIQKEVESKDEDATTFLDCLIERALKENCIGIGVRCEDRSLEELRGDLSFSRGSGEEKERSSNDENNSFSLLYDTVIGPIADLLQGEELIIVPDGPLCMAPYAAFVNQDSRYLGESTRIRIIPSLTSLKLIADCSEGYHSKSGALLVGDPCVEEVKSTWGRPLLQPLPYAKKEVEMIGDILKNAPLTGKEATKEEILKRIPSVALIHIAAHGKMETGEIALAPNPLRESNIPKEEDYILTMADVQAVKLRARLVVLSCCHSGRGKVTAEGVVGIARAFLGAGARSVLVSLWAIDDEATMEFMRSFYKHLAEGNSASVALHQAMKCLRESDKFGAVKYWAPFVLIGDDVMIKLEEQCK